MNSIELASVTRVVLFAPCAVTRFVINICPAELPLELCVLYQYTHEWAWRLFRFSHFPLHAASINIVRIGNFQNAQKAIKWSNPLAL